MVKLSKGGKCYQVFGLKGEYVATCVDKERAQALDRRIKEGYKS